MRRLIFIAVVLVSCAAVAAPKFPALTGRVVDNAHILSKSTVESLDQSLAAYENGTTNQVVVATIASLQGDSIEDYGYQLGRTWQVGQKGKNNGVVFIIAPKEHRARIEVGYGLEPILTDAASSAIINGVVLPDFRSGHLEQGVVDGTQAILSVLGGKSSVPILSSQANEQPATPSQIIGSLVVLLFFMWFAVRHPFLTAWLLSNTNRSGSSRMSDSGWGGGGFSGGGGSFGGGGASGGW